MGDYKTVADLLRGTFPDLSQRKIADCLGVEHTSVARWFSAKNGGQPTMDSCLRIARACEVDPREVFRMAGVRAEGFEELFDFYQGRPPTFKDFFLGEPDLAALVERLERLFRRGMDKELASALESLEAKFELRRLDFEQTAQNSGAEGAVLVIDHRRMTGDIFYRWQCPEKLAERLADGEEIEGWQNYVVESKSVRLRLYWLHPRSGSRDSIMTMLKIWSLGFAQLLSPDR
ncbi:MAG TPA: helix-turn-helix transcriptional regulator [Acidobacteriota bacterium]|nr:helix-turn-helix transcriptional regulator [Acidobacteriota bacterium]